MQGKVVTYVCEETGIVTVFTYKAEGSQLGLQKAEFEYPKEYLDSFKKKEKYTKNLPKTKQMFLNPKTGKEVSYYRAKALGLVK